LRRVAWPAVPFDALGSIKGATAVSTTASFAGDRAPRWTRGPRLDETAAFREGLPARDADCGGRPPFASIVETTLNAAARRSVLPCSTRPRISWTNCSTRCLIASFIAAGFVARGLGLDEAP
jgi:hypothetical protein